jgi:hypothetical protein
MRQAFFFPFSTYCYFNYFTVYQLSYLFVRQLKNYETLSYCVNQKVFISS